MEAGDVIGIVQETSIVEHKIMVPYGIKGTIDTIEEGDFTVVDTVAKIKEENKISDLMMMQKCLLEREDLMVENLIQYNL